MAESRGGVGMWSHPSLWPDHVAGPTARNPFFFFKPWKQVRIPPTPSSAAHPLPSHPPSFLSAIGTVPADVRVGGTPKPLPILPLSSCSGSQAQHAAAVVVGRFPWMSPASQEEAQATAHSWLTFSLSSTIPLLPHPHTPFLRNYILGSDSLVSYLCIYLKGEIVLVSSQFVLATACKNRASLQIARFVWDFLVWSNHFHHFFWLILQVNPDKMKEHLGISIVYPQEWRHYPHNPCIVAIYWACVGLGRNRCCFHRSFFRKKREPERDRGRGRDREGEREKNFEAY